MIIEDRQVMAALIVGKAPMYTEHRETELGLFTVTSEDGLTFVAERQTVERPLRPLFGYGDTPDDAYARLVALEASIAKLAAVF